METKSLQPRGMGKMMNWKTTATFSVIALSICVGSLAYISTTKSPGARAAKSLAKLEVGPLGMNGASGNIDSMRMGVADPKVPSSLMVYKVLPPNVSQEAVAQQAEKFGVKGTLRENPGLIGYRGVTSDFVVDKATGSKNWITKKYETRVGPIKHELTNSQYIELARKFLVDSGEYEDDYIFKGFSYYKTDNEISMVEANFGRKLNGLDWSGVGPKKAVTFGENGEILGMGSVWREVEPLAKYPLIEPNEALEQIRAGNALILIEESNASVTVEDIHLAYYNDPAGTRQKFVIPHYIVKGHTDKGNAFSAVTRAVPQSLLTALDQESATDNIDVKHSKTKEELFP